jgi:drug/metabolite transporter (DMT)-like permease
MSWGDNATGTKHRQNLSLAYFALGLTSVVWGTTWVASKIGIQGIHPLQFASVRQTLGGLCFLVFFVVTGKAVMPTKKEWGYILLMALLLFALSNGLTTWGIKYINSGLGAVLGAIFPLWVAIIDWVLGDKDKPGPLSIAGLLLGFGGVVIIFYEHLGDFSDKNFAFGVILSLLASITWAVGTVLISRRSNKLNRYYSLGLQMFVSGIFLQLVVRAGGWWMPVSSLPVITWWTLLYMVAFGSVITFGAFIYSMQHLPPTLASIYAYINPMVAVAIGHLLLGEPWSLYLAVGAVVTLAGVYLVNLGFRRYLQESQNDKGDN